MTEQELRMECLRLGFEWAQTRYREGFTGINMDDALKMAHKFYSYVQTGEPS